MRQKKTTKAPASAADIIAALIAERDAALAEYEQKQANLINALENYLIALKADRANLKG